jgi:hypothetical protein
MMTMMRTNMIMGGPARIHDYQRWGSVGRRRDGLDPNEATHPMYTAKTKKGPLVRWISLRSDPIRSG